MAGKVGKLTGVVHTDMVLHIEAHPSYFITVKRSECQPEWRVGDEVVANSLPGTITSLDADSAEVLHEAADGRPAGVSIVALHLLQPPGTNS